MNCPKCGAECGRDEADVGIGIMHGPWGCGACGWSEDDSFDLSAGQWERRDNGVIDQLGGFTPLHRRKVI